MSQASTRPYEFQANIPLSPVTAGSNLLVRGASQAGARDLALRLLLDGTTRGEGVLLASADVGGNALLERCEDVAMDVDLSRLGIVDCSGIDDDDRHRFESHADPVDDPGDLTAIEVELSALYERLHQQPLEGVRIGLFSISSLLAHGELRPVSRFVHMLTGRVIAMEDLGVFLVDEDAMDESLRNTFEQFCDGVVEVQHGDEDGGYELRVHGLDDQPGTWTPVSFDTTL